MTRRYAAVVDQFPGVVGYLKDYRYEPWQLKRRRPSNQELQTPKHADFFDKDHRHLGHTLLRIETPTWRRLIPLGLLKYHETVLQAIARLGDKNVAYVLLRSDEYDLSEGSEGYDYEVWSTPRKFKTWTDYSVFAQGELEQRIELTEQKFEAD